jgi:hypothetical protein
VFAVAASAARVFAAEENGFGTELASPRGICRGRMGQSFGGLRKWFSGWAVYGLR